MPHCNLIWVYAETGQKYKDVVNPQELIDPDYDETGNIISGSIVHFEMDSSFSLVKLTRIPEPLKKPLEKTPETVWVYYKTGLIFNQLVAESDIQNSIYDSNNDYRLQITLPVEDYYPLQGGPQERALKTHFVIERITKQLQQERINGVWVYARTGIIAEDLSNLYTYMLHSIEYDDDARALKYLRTRNGKPIVYEWISRQEVRNRAQRVWVYTGTSKKFEPIEELASVQNVQYDNKGYLKSGTLLVNDRLVTLECIARHTLRQRSNKVWVYLGTEKIFENEIDLSNTKEILYDNEENPVQVSWVLQDNQVVTIERITKAQQGIRANRIWVYEGTDIKFEGTVDLKKAVIMRSDTAGNPSCVTILEGERWITLEYISQVIQTQRARVWIYAENNAPYTGDLAKVQDISYDKAGNPISASLINGDEQISLECITQHALRGRSEKMWVYAETADIVKSDLLSEQNIQYTDKLGKTITAILLVGDKEVTIEYITRVTQNKRLNRIKPKKEKRIRAGDIESNEEAPPAKRILSMEPSQAEDEILLESEIDNWLASNEEVQTELTQTDDGYDERLLRQILKPIDTDDQALLISDAASDTEKVDNEVNLGRVPNTEEQQGDGRDMDYTNSTLLSVMADTFFQSRRSPDRIKQSTDDLNLWQSSLP